MVLGVGKTLFARLHRGMGSVERVFKAPSKELMGVNGIGEKTAAEILNFDLERNVEREFRLAEKFGFQIITLQSPDYPELLKAIYDPPPVLYYKGTPLNQLPPSVAIVGSRQPTRYGKIAAEKLSESLAAKGLCIVSGMARGIDTAAHQGAIRAGGKTAAVFGCGLSHTYPPENVSVRRRIEESGALVSEFPISTKPDKNNFPARNRVISGLSLGSVIIEAGGKSGALITAQFALDQGRDVFAVPGSIYSPQSQGTNQLIKTGAKLVDGPEAIIEELPVAVQEQLIRSACGRGKTGGAQSAGLSEKERNLMSLLSLEEKHIETLIESSQLSPAEVSATLTQLELKGLVQQRDAKMFISNCI